MTKLCGFRKIATSSQEPATLVPPAKSFGWPSPAEFDCSRGPESHAKLELSDHVSGERFCPGARQVGAVVCGYIVVQVGGHSYLHCKLRPWTHQPSPPDPSCPTLPNSKLVEGPVGCRQPGSTLQSFFLESYGGRPGNLRGRKSS